MSDQSKNTPIPAALYEAFAFTDSLWNHNTNYQEWKKIQMLTDTNRKNKGPDFTLTGGTLVSANLKNNKKPSTELRRRGHRGLGGCQRKFLTRINNTAKCGMISTLKPPKWHFNSTKTNEEFEYCGCFILPNAVINFNFRHANANKASWFKGGEKKPSTSLWQRHKYKIYF